MCSAASCSGRGARRVRAAHDELTAAIPSVVFDVKDAAGNDVSAVRVSMDGAAASTDHVGGAAVAVNPGEHTFRFEATPSPAVEKKLVIHEGEKDRHVAVSIGGDANASTTPAAATSSATAPTPATTDQGASSWNGQKTLAVVAASVGVIAVGVGSIFGANAFSKWSDAKTACGGGCGSKLSCAGAEERRAKRRDRVDGRVRRGRCGARGGGGAVVHGALGRAGASDAGGGRTVDGPDVARSVLMKTVTLGVLGVALGVSLVNLAACTSIVGITDLPRSTVGRAPVAGMAGESPHRSGHGRSRRGRTPSPAPGRRPRRRKTPGLTVTVARGSSSDLVTTGGCGLEFNVTSTDTATLLPSQSCTDTATDGEQITITRPARSSSTRRARRGPSPSRARQLTRTKARA